MTPNRQRSIDLALAAAVVLPLLTAAWDWFWGTFTLWSAVSDHEYRMTALALAFVFGFVATPGALAMAWLPASRWVRRVWLAVCVLLAALAVLALVLSFGAPPDSAPDDDPIASQMVVLTLVFPTTYPVVVAGVVAVVNRLRGRSSRGRRSRPDPSSAPGRRASVGS